MRTCPETNAEAKRARARGRRRWWFRLAAMGLGFAPLLLVELLLTALGWGEPTLHEDLFVGFRSTRPLFVLNEAAGRYEISPARQQFFRPESFPARKTERERRIFCLGGSTVQGRPFAIETSFTTWLEIELNVAAPQWHWEVVNCGGVSYASYRLIPILQEILHYEPDLIIVYTGQNEFLEDRTYGHIKRRSPALNWLLEEARDWRTFTLVRSAYLQLSENANAAASTRPVLPSEVEPMLDYRGGLEQYHWDAGWREDVIAHYGHNLRCMIQRARQADVPLLLVNPACNIRDCPPFKAEHRAGLTAAELRRWEQLVDQARCSQPQQAITLLQEAARLDEQHAGLAYELAKCYDALGQFGEARKYYLRAKDLDVCPLRILEPMHEQLWQVARETSTPVVDARALIERHSRDGIPGSFLLIDHVHPSIRGHQMLAAELVQQLEAIGWFQPTRADWTAERERRFEEHLASLDDLYFLRGQQRLEALRNWAAGRATKDRALENTARSARVLQSP